MALCGGNCKTSTGLHGGSTFGTGKLDENGYWEKPCKQCERIDKILDMAVNREKKLSQYDFKKAGSMAKDVMVAIMIDKDIPMDIKDKLHSELQKLRDFLAEKSHD